MSPSFNFEWVGCIFDAILQYTQNYAHIIYIYAAISFVLYNFNFGQYRCIQLSIYYRYKFSNDTLIIYFSICSSSVGATSDCVFLAPPGQQGHRDGSVSPNTAKRDRSISVIAGKSIKNTSLFTRSIFYYTR